MNVVAAIHRLAILVLLTVGAGLTFAPPAAAQGCAMCYQNAASSGAQGQAALRHGILILLVPALSLFVGVLALVYHRRSPSPRSSRERGSGAE